MHTHKIPHLLETEDLFLFGLTIRQCLILFVGAITSYLLFSSLFAWFSNPNVGLVVGLLVALLFLSGMVAIAFVHHHGRGLEEWGLVLLLYLSRPHIFLWHPNTPDAFERRICRQQARARGAGRLLVAFPRRRKERAW